MSYCHKTFQFGYLVAFNIQWPEKRFLKKISKCLFIDTVSMNKKYRVDTVSMNKKYRVDTVSTNKKYRVDTLSCKILTF